MKTLLQIFLAIAQVATGWCIVYYVVATLIAFFVLTAGMQFLLAVVMMFVYALIIAPAVEFVFAKLRKLFGVRYSYEENTVDFQQARAQFDDFVQRDYTTWQAENC